MSATTKCLDHKKKNLEVFPKHVFVHILYVFGCLGYIPLHVGQTDIKKKKLNIELLTFHITYILLYYITKSLYVYV